MVRFFAALSLALVSPLLLAAPAHWYLWKGRPSGAIACAQTSPGEAWVREDGPYKDSRCTVRLDHPAAAA